MKKMIYKNDYLKNLKFWDKNTLEMRYLYPFPREDMEDVNFLEEYLQSLSAYVMLSEVLKSKKIQ